MKSKGLFHFKKFSLSDRNSTHKIGTDGVLLGAWVDIGEAQRILDIGTGSGLIALMVAQRSDAEVLIDAIEINEVDVAQARKNVDNSPWASKVMVHHIALQQFHSSDQYDLIVSNPPYFMNSWLPPDENRTKARHTSDLSFEALLKSSKNLLSGNGRLAVVLPLNEAEIFKTLASEEQLYLNRSLSFQSRKEKPIERMLMEFGKNRVPIEAENLVLYSEGEVWSPEYRSLTKDFYLKA